MTHFSKWTCVFNTLKGFIDSTYEEFKNENWDDVLAGLIDINSRVLDVGCGDGSLLLHLKKTKELMVGELKSTK